MLRPSILILCLALAAWPASGDVVKLANGDELHGEIVEWAVEHIVIDHPQLGEVRLSLDQLEVDTGKPPTPGLFDTNFLRGWQRHIDVGVNGERATTDSTTVTVGLAFRYRDPFKHWRVDGRYYFNESDDGDADNNGRLFLRRDWLRPSSRWFTFAGQRYQYDKYESWEHRVSLFGGPGYHLFKTDAQALDLLVGPVYTREFGDRDDDQGEIGVGLDYDWKISERQSLEIDNQMFWELSPESGELRNVTQANYRFRLTDEPAVSLNLGIFNEYETDTEDDDERNDLKYHMSLGMDF